MMPRSSAGPAIDFWFDFGSTYSYLSVMRIERLAQAKGVAVAWRPMLLGPIFRELGWRSSPFLEQKEKEAYMWQDMVRQCRKYGLAWRHPTVFPRLAILPLRVVQAWADEPWIGDFCRGVMLQNFDEDVDINAPENVAKVLSALGLQPQEVIEAAVSDTNKEALRVQTQRARDRGIFGAPTFFAGDAMFWGNDRLEDALDHAQAER